MRCCCLSRRVALLLHVRADAWVLDAGLLSCVHAACLTSTSVLTVAVCLHLLCLAVLQGVQEDHSAGVQVCAAHGRPGRV